MLRRVEAFETVPPTVCKEEVSRRHVTTVPGGATNIHIALGLFEGADDALNSSIDVAHTVQLFPQGCLSVVSGVLVGGRLGGLGSLWGLWCSRGLGPIGRRGGLASGAGRRPDVLGEGVVHDGGVVHVVVGHGGRGPAAGVQ